MSDAARQGLGGHGSYGEDSREYAAGLLASGLSVAQVALTTGISEKSLNRWRREDAPFRARLKVLQAQQREVACDRIAGLVDQSVGVLAEIMLDTSQPGAVRRACACDILDRAGIVGLKTDETRNDSAELELMSAADLASALRRASEALERPPTPTVDAILDTKTTVSVPNPPTDEPKPSR